MTGATRIIMVSPIEVRNTRQRADLCKNNEDSDFNHVEFEDLVGTFKGR